MVNRCWLMTDNDESWKIMICRVVRERDEASEMGQQEDKHSEKLTLLPLRQRNFPAKQGQETRSGEKRGKI
jgi:hypothetical protein